MMLIGDKAASDRAAHRLAGSDQIMVATAAPIAFYFDGWELAEHPHAPGRGTEYRLRATCLRHFLFQCAYRDDETWRLPPPLAIFSHDTTRDGKLVGDSQTWPFNRPYAALAWHNRPANEIWFGLFPPRFEIWNAKENLRTRDWGDFGTLELDDTPDEESRLSNLGAAIYRIAVSTYGKAGIAGLIPAGVPHDILLTGLAYRRVRKRWLVDEGPPEVFSEKSSERANRRLLIHINIVSAADGRRGVS